MREQRCPSCAVLLQLLYRYNFNVSDHQAALYTVKRSETFSLTLGLCRAQMSECVSSGSLSAARCVKSVCCIVFVCIVYKLYCIYCVVYVYKLFCDRLTVSLKGVLTQCTPTYFSDSASDLIAQRRTDKFMFVAGLLLNIWQVMIYESSL